MKDLAIMYHYVRDKEEWRGSVPISPEDFRKQIKLIKNHYKIMLPSEAKYSVKNFNKCIITFDDSTKDQYENAYHILKEEGVKGYFAIMSGPLIEKKIPVFHLVHAILSKMNDEELWEQLNFNFNIPTNIDEISGIYQYEKNLLRRYNKYLLNFHLTEEQSRDFLEHKLVELYGPLDQFLKDFYISEEEIIEMHKNGMEIGVHCVHHKKYDGSPELFFNNEIKPCLDYLTQLLGVSPKWYAPAFGGGEQPAKILRDLTPILKMNGFIGGFTTISGFCNFNDDDFWHNRIDCNKLNNFLKEEEILNL